MFVRNQQTREKVNSTLTDIAEVAACFLDPLSERLLSLTNPNTGVIELRRSMNGNLREDNIETYLLVGFVCTFGVANLSDQVVFFLENKVLEHGGQLASSQ
jgi:hypothetical protein